MRHWRACLRWGGAALALMCVLNAFVYSVALHMSPPTDPSQAMFIPAAFRSPVLLTLFLLEAEASRQS